MGIIMPIIKLSHPIKLSTIKKIFLLSMSVSRIAGQSIIPKMNRTTHAALSFLFKINEER